MLVDVIVAGAVFENGKDAPTEGLNSTVILVFFVTHIATPLSPVLKSISTCVFGDNVFASVVVPLSTAENFVVEADASYVRIVGAVSGVENAIFIASRSSDGEPGASPIVNLISSIPWVVEEDSP